MEINTKFKDTFWTESIGFKVILTFFCNCFLSVVVMGLKVPHKYYYEWKWHLSLKLLLSIWNSSFRCNGCQCKEKSCSPPSICSLFFLFKKHHLILWKSSRNKTSDLTILTDCVWSQTTYIVLIVYTHTHICILRGYSEYICIHGKICFTTNIQLPRIHLCLLLEP